MTSHLRPAATLAVLLAAATLGGCTTTSGDNSEDPLFLKFLLAATARQPGGDPDGELGGAGATTIGLGYQKATLTKTDGDLVLRLEDRRANPFDPIVARFDTFRQADNVVDGLVTSRSDKLSIGGVSQSTIVARMLDGGEIDDLTFLSFAYWAVYDTDDDDRLITAAGGPIGDVAADLSAAAGLKNATYIGTTLGARSNVDGSQFRLLSADIVLKADFVGNMMRADITRMRLIDPVSGGSVGRGPDLSFENAAIGTILGVPGFQGKTDDGTFTAELGGQTIGPSTGSFAELSGAFYGNDLQEVGGGWFVATPGGNQPAAEWSGSFGAKR